MDSELLRRTLAERFRTARLVMRQTQQLLAGDIFSTQHLLSIECDRLLPSMQVLMVLAGHFSGSAPWAANHAIQQQPANAGQYIQQPCLAQPLSLLQTPVILPYDWPLSWHPRWYALVGWALIRHNRPQEVSGALEGGLQVLEHLLHQPRAAGLPFLRELGEWLRYFLGASFCCCDQPVQALLCHQQGLVAIADGTIRDPELIMHVYKGLGNAYLVLGAYRQAITFFLLARKQAQDVYAPRAQGLIAWGLGLAYKLQGNLLQAKDALAQALQFFEQFDAKPLMAQVRSLLGQVLLQLQCNDEARVVLRQAVGAAERIGDPHTRGMALGSMAVWHLAEGRPTQAIRTLQDGLAALQETRDQQIVGQLYLLLARAYKSLHHQNATERALKKAIWLLRQTQHQGLIVRAHECYGYFLADQERFQEAYEQLRAALQKLIP